MNRRRPTRNRYFRLALVITSLTLVFAGLLHLFMPQSLAPDAERPGPARGLGFATTLANLAPAERDKRLLDMKSMGAQWVRIDLSWNRVQPDGPDRFSWQETDAEVKAIGAHGLKPLLILNFTPAWARQSECADLEQCAPRDAEEFGKFAGAAAGRYAKVDGTAWEIWNEPNIAERFAPKADPVQYAAMVRAAYGAIKSADPDAIVVAGSTSPVGDSAINISPLKFVEAMYANGAGGSFDALSAHPYTYPGLARDAHFTSAWGQMLATREVMKRNGDGRKLIWQTEYGTPTNSFGQQSNPLAEIHQAEMAADAIAEFYRYEWAGPFFWYEYQDSRTYSPQAKHDDFFGVIRGDGSRKPVYSALVEGAKTAAGPSGE